MEESRKRQLDGNAVDFGGKRARNLPTVDDTEKSSTEDEDVINALLCITDDDGANELAKLLDTEATWPVRVKFIDDPYSPSRLIFQSSSSFITINGNEESCGSSFSDLESSVMASVDRGRFPAADGGACVFLGEAARGVVIAEEIVGGCDVRETDDCDSGELDDEMLSRFIGEEPFE